VCQKDKKLNKLLALLFSFSFLFAKGTIELHALADKVPAEVEIVLSKGWNLVSIPSFGSILTSELSSFKEIKNIYGYENSNWVLLRTDVANGTALTKMESTKGYWLNANDSFSLKIIYDKYNGKNLKFAPVSIDSIKDITPLGNLNPPFHTFPTTHTYIHLKESVDTQNVILAGDASIRKIKQFTEEDGRLEYGIDFYINDKVYGYYIHMSDLNSTLKDELKGLENCVGASYCEKDVRISMSGGTTVGYVGEKGFSRTLDFGLRDLSKVAYEFISAERFISSDILHTQCPYSYYFNDVSDALIAKLDREAEPKCGQINYDKLATAQGIWYAKNRALEGEEHHLALVPSNFNPVTQVFSVGNYDVGIGSYYYNPLESGTKNRAFIDIKSDGNIYCFDRLRNREIEFHAQSYSGSMILQMIDEVTLKLERVENFECNETRKFTGKAQTFVR